MIDWKKQNKTICEQDQAGIVVFFNIWSPWILSFSCNVTPNTLSSIVSIKSQSLMSTKYCWFQRLCVETCSKYERERHKNCHPWNSRCDKIGFYQNNNAKITTVISSSTFRKFPSFFSFLIRVESVSSQKRDPPRFVKKPRISGEELYIVRF